MREYALHQAQQLGSPSSQGFLTRLWESWKSRRMVARLAEFDDHLLQDIGVTRANVEEAKTTQWLEDAMHRLRSIAVSGQKERTRAGQSVLDARHLSDHFKRDIGWLDGHATPNSNLNTRIDTYRT